MPRSGDGVYSLPPNTAAVTGQTIASAKYNTVNNDIANDLNAARPITAGGTGATNPTDALANLGGVGQENFLDAYSIGDFYETVRNIASVNGVWLRRNGALHDSADYPELAALLPALTDSVDWSLQSVGTSSAFNDIAYGGGKYVGVGDGGIIYYSSDRTTWNPANSGTTKNLVSVTYGSGTFVAISTDRTKVVSNDAENWSVGTIGSGTDSYYCIRYLNGQFIVAGGTSSNYAFIGTSSDAITVSSNKISTTDGGFIRSVIWTGAYYLTISEGSGSFARSYKSTDANTWTSAVNGVNSGYSLATDGTTVVLVGANGAMASTINGTAFTPRASGTSNTLRSVTYSPDAKWLAVGDGGVARISSNVSSWSGTTTGTTANLYAATYDPLSTYNYVVVGANGVVLNGLRTSPTQFRVPNDDPTYGWIKAENAT